MATKVDSTTSAQPFLAADAYRRGFIVENSDANRLYVLVGSGTVSATNYSFSLGQNENARIMDAKGAVSGIWAGDGSGSAFITVLE